MFTTDFLTEMTMYTISLVPVNECNMCSVAEGERRKFTYLYYSYTEVSAISFDLQWDCPFDGKSDIYNSMVVYLKSLLRCGSCHVRSEKHLMSVTLLDLPTIQPWKQCWFAIKTCRAMVPTQTGSAQIITLKGPMHISGLLKADVCVR